MAVFLYGVKSPESKRQYPRRFKMFLDFLHLPGDVQDQAKKFLRNAKANPKWVQTIIKSISLLLQEELGTNHL